MIAPRTRLIVFALFLLVPLATLAGIQPSLLAVSLLAACFLCILPLVDLVIGFGRHRNLTITLPPEIRGTLGQPFILDFALTDAPPSRGRIRISAAFPDSLQAEKPYFTYSGDPGKRIVSIRVTSLIRGNFQITDVYFDWISPLQFWVFRDSRPVECQIQIFPNLAREGRLLATFLNRGAIGVRAQRQIGRGREFEKLRLYEPGDGLDEIHWKATAKHRFPVTKVFQLERSQEVYVLLDTSRLSGRFTTNNAEPAPEDQDNSDLNRNQQWIGGTRPAPIPARTTHLDRAISTALLFCIAAQRQGDLFGLVTFSNKVDHLVKARAGSVHFNLCRDIATGLQPKLLTPDFVEIATTIRQNISRRSLLVFLTALDDSVLAEDFATSAELLAKRHILLVVMIAPGGLKPLFDRDKPQSISQIYERLAGHLRWVRLQELEKTLRRKGIQFHVVPNEQLALKVVSFYMDLKRRQLL
jgi:uncharacterized protein (DUF58 family)